ncbi:hypothetical protein [Microcystis phage Mel-JY01]
MKKISIDDAATLLGKSHTEILMLGFQGKLTLDETRMVCEDALFKQLHLQNTDCGVIDNDIKIDPIESDSLKTKIGFNGLTASEWARLSKVVIDENEILNEVWKLPTERRNIYHLNHGAAYPVKLVERLAKMYCPENGIVFDPFMGTGTTLVGAHGVNRNAIGIELTQKYFDVANSWINDVCDKFPNGCTYTPIFDDCRNMKQYVSKNTVHCTITSPPYANFIHRSVKDRNARNNNSIIIENNSTVQPYSALDTDFGNLSYKDFLKQIKNVLKDNLELTVPGGYACWIVKDYRDTKNGIPYISFHSDVAELAKSVGWNHHDVIIWNQAEQRRLMVLGFPSTLYANQNCSFIVVLRKPMVPKKPKIIFNKNIHRKNKM